jgi:hypothetical protein
MESEFKRRMMVEKQGLNQEKQQLALEFTRMESEMLKKKEQLSLNQQEV